MLKVIERAKRKKNIDISSTYCGAHAVPKYVNICHTDYFGIDARKPVFGDLRTTKAQTSLHIHADWSAPLLFAFWKVSYLNLLRAKFHNSN